MESASSTVASSAFLFLFFGTIAYSADQDRPSALLSRDKTPPTIVRNLDDESKWHGIIQAGVDEARRYFGSFGPTYVYILGHEDGKLNTKEYNSLVVDEYCRRRRERSTDESEQSLQRMNDELIRKAISGRGDAYLSTVEQAETPFAELVFINPHEFGDPYLYTRGIHEYTHVFQRSFPTTPTWMMEGGAEFFACYLGEKRGWAELEGGMNEFMRNVKSIDNRSLGIRDMEDVDKAPPEIKKYYRHLAYDAGAWAVAFMIHESKSQSVGDVPRKFYPLVDSKGWEVALAEFVNMESKQAFYDAFGEFLKQPIESQLKMLKTLKD